MAVRGRLVRSVLIVTLTLATAFGAGRVVNVAHRGGAFADHPENSLAAFRRAITAGADVIELDLRATSDGEIVILHDETLDRTTRGAGKVTDHTLAEVSQLGIPTFREVLQLCVGTGIRLLLDIKVSPKLDKPKVVQLARQYDVDVVFGVRTVEDLREFQRLAPDSPTLAFVPSVDAIGEFVAAGADIVRLWLHWIKADASLVETVRRAGKPVWVTANDAPPAELRELIGMGVDGILTDRPDTLARLIGR